MIEIRRKGQKSAAECPPRAPITNAHPQTAESVAWITSNPSAGTVQTATQNAPQQARGPFVAPTDHTRDYKRIYRALYDFHERHNPPTQDSDYWSDVNSDMIETAERFNQDPYVIGLLEACFEELERQYKQGETN